MQPWDQENRESSTEEKRQEVLRLQLWVLWTGTRSGIKKTRESSTKEKRQEVLRLQQWGALDRNQADLEWED